MIIAGIDYSINCPCICIYDEKDGKLSHNTSKYFFNQFGVSKKEIARRSTLQLDNIYCNNQYKFDNNYSRYFTLADWVISLLVQYDVDTVCIEDYALHAQGLVFNVAEATSILRHLIMMCGFSLYAWSPTLVKKIWTSKGNSDKNIMSNHYFMRYGINISDIMGKSGNYDSPISDIVDSHAMIYTFYNYNNKEEFKLF